MPYFALINKLDGNLLTVDTSTGALSSTAIDRTPDSKLQVFDIGTSQGHNNFTIQQPSTNKYLSHFDGSHVDFNGTSAGSAYVDGTNIMWEFKTVDTLSGFSVYRISSVNDSRATCLTAKGSQIVAREYTGKDNQLWFKKDMTRSDLNGPLQAIIHDRQQVIDDLKAQIKELEKTEQDEDDDRYVHGKDAAGWYSIARVIFQNGVTMYQWGPVSPEQQDLGQKYWFRGFDAIYG